MNNGYGSYFIGLCRSYNTTNVAEIELIQPLFGTNEFTNITTLELTNLIVKGPVSTGLFPNPQPFIQWILADTGDSLFLMENVTIHRFNGGEQLLSILTSTAVFNNVLMEEIVHGRQRSSIQADVVSFSNIEFKRLVSPSITFEIFANSINMDSLSFHECTCAHFFSVQAIDLAVSQVTVTSSITKMMFEITSVYNATFTNIDFQDSASSLLQTTVAHILYLDTISITNSTAHTGPILLSTSGQALSFTLRNFFYEGGLNAVELITVIHFDNIQLENIVVQNTWITYLLSVSSALNVTIINCQAYNTIYYFQFISVTADNVIVDGLTIGGLTSRTSEPTIGTIDLNPNSNSTSPSLSFKNCNFSNIFAGNGIIDPSAQKFIQTNNYDDVVVSNMNFTNVNQTLINIGNAQTLDISDIQFRDIVEAFDQLLLIVKITCLTITNILIENTSIFGPFGIIEITDSTGSLSHITVTNNGNSLHPSATAVVVRDCNITLSDLFIFNSNAPRAGALFSSKSIVAISNSTFE